MGRLINWLLVITLRIVNVNRAILLLNFAKRYLWRALLMTKNKTKFRAVNYWKAIKLVHHKIKPYSEFGYAWRLQYLEHRPVIFRRKDLRQWKSLKFFRKIQYKSIEW